MVYVPLGRPLIRFEFVGDAERKYGFFTQNAIAISSIYVACDLKSTEDALTRLDQMHMHGFCGFVWVTTFHRFENIEMFFPTM